MRTHYSSRVVYQNRGPIAYKLLDMHDKISGLLRFNKQYCLDNPREVSDLITRAHKAGALRRSGLKSFFLLKEYDLYYKTFYLFNK
jgi:hypothetical protein